MHGYIVTFTTNGESREDGNVYYARSVLVQHPTKNFDEDVFSAITDEKDPDVLISAMEELGYRVSLLPEIIIASGEEEE
jgi:hypothetical protein